MQLKAYIIWEKYAGSNSATVKYQPMKEHEEVLIFIKEITEEEIKGAI